MARRAVFGRFPAAALPTPGFLSPEQGTSGHFHTSCIGRALLFAQDRRWEDLASIFVIALLDFNTPDR